MKDPAPPLGAAIRLVDPAAPADPAPRIHRWLVLHLPSFGLERCGYPADELAALIAEQKQAMRVIARTDAAASLGIARGMTATEARALVPNISLEPWDPEAEARDRAALMNTLEQLSDRVEWLGEHIALEVGSTSKVLGGERRVMQLARELCIELGHSCALALADDVVTARAVIDPAADAASTSGLLAGILVPPNGSAAALAQLQVSRLGLSATLLNELAEIGIRTVGQLARLDPASIAARYGTEGVRFHRIARGVPDPGGAADPQSERIDELRGEIATPILASVVFPEPTETFQPIGFELPGLVRKIAAMLDARDRAAIRLLVRFVLDRGAPASIRVRVGRPTSHPPRLEQLIRARLENIKLEAPISGIQLQVEESCPSRGWQPSLLDRSEASELLVDLQARLVDALGPQALFAAEPIPEAAPEAGWRPTPFTGAAGSTAEDPRTVDLYVASGKLDPVLAQTPFDAALPPRPSLLLPEPSPIDVREERGLPTHIKVTSAWLEVTRCASPERLDGGWWRPSGGFDRLYRAVELGRVSAWVFQDQRTRRWWLHGWFD